jgi:GR25 family glycosyltransferase involved in LPS biosynthesis
MWTNFFDKIVVLNIPEREDRMESVVSQSRIFQIPIERIEAIKNDNGQAGIYDSLMKLFTAAVKEDLKRILVFEDDFKITRSDLNPLMEKVIQQLPGYWHMLYLGANLPNPTMVTQYSANLLITKRALALHAVAYSRECMEMILALPRQLPVDLQIASFIHPLGHTYVTYPLLCTQRDGISDIDKVRNEEGKLIGKKSKNDFYITPRYIKVCEYLNLQP